MDSKTLFRPNALNVTLSLVYFALLIRFLSPALSLVTGIPCLFDETSVWGWCSINPLGTLESTTYFGMVLFDVLYQVLYLLSLCALAYTFASLSLYSYSQRKS